MKRLAQFDLEATSSIEPAVLAALAAGAWITARAPVVLLGDSGTGKTHRSSVSVSPPARRASGSAT